MRHPVKRKRKIYREWLVEYNSAMWFYIEEGEERWSVYGKPYSPIGQPHTLTRSIYQLRELRDIFYKDYSAVIDKEAQFRIRNINTGEIIPGEALLE